MFIKFSENREDKGEQLRNEAGETRRGMEGLRGRDKNGIRISKEEGTCRNAFEQMHSWHKYSQSVCITHIQRGNKEGEEWRTERT